MLFLRKSSALREKTNQKASFFFWWINVRPEKTIYFDLQYIQDWLPTLDDCEYQLTKSTLHLSFLNPFLVLICLFTKNGKTSPPGPYKWIICVCSYNNISSILLPTLQCCENVLLVLESCSANYRVTDCFPLLNILRFFARQSLTLIFYRHIFSVVTLCTFVYVITDTRIVLFSILYMSSFALIYHFCTFVP